MIQWLPSLSHPPLSRNNKQSSPHLCTPTTIHCTHKDISYI